MNQLEINPVAIYLHMLLRPLCPHCAGSRDPLSAVSAESPFPAGIACLLYVTRLYRPSYQPVIAGFLPEVTYPGGARRGVR